MKELLGHADKDKAEINAFVDKITTAKTGLAAPTATLC